MMTKQILKPIALGVLAGVLFFAPPFFLFRILGVALIIGLISRLFGFSRYGRRFHPAFASSYQKMSADERKAFVENFGRGHCGHGFGYAPQPEPAKKTTTAGTEPEASK